MTPRLIPPLGMNRRHFMGHLAASALVGPAARFLGGLNAHAQTLRNNQKHCILLWMGGGPSQLDTFDPKPNSPRNGGEFRAIETTVPGVRVCEHLPNVARQMHHLNIIRSMSTNEGNHERGTYLMHTGYQPNPTVAHPAFGSICSFELGPKLGEDFPLPHCVSINRPGESAGFLGMAHAPFAVNNPNAPVENLDPAVQRGRLGRRIRMLDLVERRFIRQTGDPAAADHQAVYEKTLRMMNSSYTKAFELDDEPEPIREAYGKDSFGAGCLMARRLIQAGVTFVEVGFGGWDNHDGIFSTLREDRLPKLDRAMAALVADLERNGLLEHTLVVWMGEFGRTPRVNQDSGRDHWPRSWSVVVGGGGLKGGQVIGATDADGVEVEGTPHGVGDLLASMCQAMGIDPRTEFITPLGRPIKVVDDGAPIAELF